MAPSSPKPFERAIRIASYAAGVALAAVLLAAWQVPNADRAPRTDVSFQVNLSGELAVTPTGTFLRAPALVAGSGAAVARGRFRIRNQTPAALTIRPRAVPSTRTLDRLLLVSVGAGGRRVFRGRLGELRSGTQRPIALAPGESSRVTVRTRLRGGSAAAGVHERIRIDLSARTRR